MASREFLMQYLGLNAVLGLNMRIVPLEVDGSNGAESGCVLAPEDAGYLLHRGKLQSYLTASETTPPSGNAKRAKSTQRCIDHINFELAVAMVIKKSRTWIEELRENSEGHGSGALYAADGFVSQWNRTRHWDTATALACLIVLKQGHSVQHLINAGLNFWQIANGIEWLIRQGHMKQRRGTELVRDARAMLRYKSQDYNGGHGQSWYWEKEPRYVAGWRS